MSDTAWILKWTYAGSDPDRVPDEIAGILPSDTSIAEVARAAELLYSNAYFSLSERLSLALGSWQNPWPPRIDEQREAISCGHNPFITARRVSNPRIIGSDEEETLQFD